MIRKAGLRVMVAMMVVTTAVVLGCGGDSKGGSAEAKCNEFVEQACKHWIECGLVDEDDFDDCVDAIEDEGLSCGDAVSVSRDYAECLSDLRSDECPDEPELPSSCENAITVDG
ncbi:MAG: hypothetical protein ABW252_07115 [Polyangiales bacterium]